MLHGFAQKASAYDRLCSLHVPAVEMGTCAEHLLDRHVLDPSCPTYMNGCTASSTM